MSEISSRKLRLSLRDLVLLCLVVAVWSSAYVTGLKRQKMERMIDTGGKWFGIVKPEDRHKVNLIRIPDDISTRHWKIIVPEGKRIGLKYSTIAGATQFSPLTTFEELEQISEGQKVGTIELDAGRHTLLVHDSQGQLQIEVDGKVAWRSRTVLSVGAGFRDTEAGSIAVEQVDPEIVLWKTNWSNNKKKSDGEIEGYIIWLDPRPVTTVIDETKEPTE
jgi:hypothetical protein